MAMVTAWDLLLESEVVLQRIRVLKDQRAESRVSGQLAEMFAEVGIEALRELRRLGHLPADDASRLRIANLLGDRLEPYTEILKNGAMDAAQHGRNRIIRELQRQGVSIQFSEISASVRRQIEQHTFEASQRTLERLTGNVMENLTRSYSQGLGIDDAARELQDVFDGLQDFEAERIARTEINGAQQRASHATMQELGIGYEQWISADDARTRESHAELNGVITRTNDPFPNGLQHPGDFGPGIIEEAINCRCRVVPVIPPRGAVPPPGQDWWYPGDWVQSS